MSQALRPAVPVRAHDPMAALIQIDPPRKLVDTFVRILRTQGVAIDTLSPRERQGLKQCLSLITAMNLSLIDRMHACLGRALIMRPDASPREITQDTIAQIDRVLMTATHLTWKDIEKCFEIYRVRHIPLSIEDFAKKCPNVTSLDLSGSEMDNVTFARYAHAFKNNRIESIHLCGTNITEVGVAFYLPLFTNTLVDLKLAGIAKLTTLDCLKPFNQLRTCVVEDCPDLTDTTALATLPLRRDPEVGAAAAGPVFSANANASASASATESPERPAKK